MVPSKCFLIELATIVDNEYRFALVLTQIMDLAQGA